jgi:hypothetical protein
MTLGVGGLILYLVGTCGNGRLVAEDRANDQVLTVCAATTHREAWDGRRVSISGRYLLGASGSADAPKLLQDVGRCATAGGQASLLAEFGPLKRTPAADRFEELKTDLVPVPCPVRMWCVPDRAPRRLYADLVVVGRFQIVPEGDRSSAYCCRVRIEEVASVSPGPERNVGPALRLDSTTRTPLVDGRGAE